VPSASGATSPSDDQLKAMMKAASDKNFAEVREKVTSLQSENERLQEKCSALEEEISELIGKVNFFYYTDNSDRAIAEEEAKDREANSLHSLKVI
jgi:predicted RNase H-like nuclease (RuvC/YqgF family)